MKRRDALKALMGLPPLAAISVATLKPKDVIVAECAGPISEAAAARIRAGLKLVWPDHEAVVVGDGLTIKVVRSGQEA